MSPELRRLALTLHVATSVGWFGAVLAFLALAVVNLTSHEVDSVRAANLAMWMIGWYVMVPISLASLLTGLVQSLGTRWGLVRHYWVLLKLMLNLIATAVLLLYTQTLDHLAQTAAVPGSTVESLRNPSPTIHAGGALVLLAAATVLAVYKPQGVTRYGRRVAGTRATVRQR